MIISFVSRRINIIHWIIHRMRMRMIFGRIRISRMIIFRCTSVSRDNLSETRDGRRESEAVIHGTSYNHTMMVVMVTMMVIILMVVMVMVMMVVLK